MTKTKQSSAGVRGRISPSNAYSGEALTRATQAPRPTGLALRYQAWAPGIQTAFKLLFSVRIVCALSNVFLDCDEVFNYWEPTHYMIYKSGFQTWEYSPEFALRSYGYLLPQAAVGIFLNNFGLTKLQVFYVIKLLLATLAAACETLFYAGVRHFFNRPPYYTRSSTWSWHSLVIGSGYVPLLTLVFMLVSPGLLLAAPAYLPNSFSMLLFAAGLGLVLMDRHVLALYSFSCGTLLGTPFALVAYAPVCLYILYVCGMARTLTHGLLSLFIFLVPQIVVDQAMYGQAVVALYNTIKYNGVGAGDYLYGVEDKMYYLVNGMLNFGIVFPVALVAVPVLLLLWAYGTIKTRRLAAEYEELKKTQTDEESEVKKSEVVAHTRGTSYLVMCLCVTVPCVLWLCLMTLRPHKEERFIYVVYHSLLLSAAIFLDKLTPRKGRILGVWLGLLVLVVLGFGLARYIGLVSYYSAPMKSFTYLSEVELKKTQISDSVVCVGKEWYRFPSSFFLPNNTKLGFVRSGSSFLGELPRPYSAKYGSSRVPPHFNDQNRDEQTRYIPLEMCHYLVDLDGPLTKPPHHFNDTSNWEVLVQYEFLNRELTPWYHRALLLPFKQHEVVYDTYYVLKHTAAVQPWASEED